MAAAGMVIGAAVYLSSPSPAQASTTLLLTNGPEAAPGTAIADDQADDEGEGGDDLEVNEGLEADAAHLLRVCFGIHGVRARRRVRSMSEAA